jgi:hypothetical protein
VTKLDFYEPSCSNANTGIDANLLSHDGKPADTCKWGCRMMLQSVAAANRYDTSFLLDVFALLEKKRHGKRKFFARTPRCIMDPSLKT